jgi:hypothetical protein
MSAQLASCSLLAQHIITYLGVWTGELDLLTTCTHHSELQVITALSVISTLYTSLHAKSSLACSVSNSRSLATASNIIDSPAFRAHVVTVCRTSRNWTHSADLGSSLYSLGADPTENTASNNFSIVMGSCLAIARISFSRKSVYRTVAQKRSFGYSPNA